MWGGCWLTAQALPRAAGQGTPGMRQRIALVRHSHELGSQGVDAWGCSSIRGAPPRPRFVKHAPAAPGVEVHTVSVSVALSCTVQLTGLDCTVI